MSLPLFPKKRSQLPPFTSFHSIHMQNSPKNFRSCEAIGKKTCEFFTTNNKQYNYDIDSVTRLLIKKLENNNYCYWVVSHIPTFNITNGTIYWLDPKTAHAMEPC